MPQETTLTKTMMCKPSVMVMMMTMKIMMTMTTMKASMEALEERSFRSFQVPVIDGKAKVASLVRYHARDLLWADPTATLMLTAMTTTMTERKETPAMTMMKRVTKSTLTLLLVSVSVELVCLALALEATGEAEGTESPVSALTVRSSMAMTMMKKATKNTLTPLLASGSVELVCLALALEATGEAEGTESPMSALTARLSMAMTMIKRATKNTLTLSLASGSVELVCLALALEATGEAEGTESPVSALTAKSLRTVRAIPRRMTLMQLLERAT
jgi:hypothetical protein